MFSALSFNHGDLNTKISVYIALAPVMFLENTRLEFMQALVDDSDSIAWWLDSLNIHEIFGPDWVVA